MKKIILILTLVFTAYSCKAQTPIVNRDASISEQINGTYFKDINNEFNKFSGTWQFSDGNTILTIKLEKKEMVYDGFEYYFDELFGEYSYTENGVEIINTLASLEQSPNDFDARNIGGGQFIPTNLFAPCDNCDPNERRVKLYFNDPQRSYLSVSLILRYLQDADQFGQDAQMTATIVPIGGGEFLPTKDSPTETRVPYGEYLMVKQ